MGDTESTAYFDRPARFAASARERTALGAWITHDSVHSARALAGTDAAFVILDAQHGALDDRAVDRILTGIAEMDPLPIVRVPWNDPATIMRALDNGALGIVCPMVNSRAECEAFVGATRYAPRGYRSWGPVRITLFDGDAAQPERAETPLSLAMIETAEAVAAIESIVSVEGLDGIFIGPADLAITMGLEPWQQDHPDLVRALEAVIDASHRAGILVGAAPLSPQLAGRLGEMGVDFVTVGSDLSFMQDGARRYLNPA